MTYIKENINTKLQKLYSLPRNPRAGALSPVCKIFIERPAEWIPYFNIFLPFVVHFLVNHCKQLRLETCWLITGGTYQINGLMG